MKVRFNRWYNALLTMLLSMLGFESCSSTKGEVPVEYGCPYADYIVKGTVTDEAGAPIQGIKITAPYGDVLSSQYSQTVLTDASGAFTLNEFSSRRGSLMRAEDIDGEANGGEFMSDSVDVRGIKDTKLIEKGSDWYEGKIEVTANFKLKKK